MKSVTLKSRIGADGFLRVKIPTKIKEKNVDVLIVYDVRGHAYGAKTSNWPENYFDETYNALALDPIERLPQGAYPEREQLQ